MVSTNSGSWVSTSRQFYGTNNPPVRKNLEFFIGLRNRIEHCSLAQLDPEIFGECQAMLLNFESLLTTEFGDRQAIRGGLSFTLILKTTTKDARRGKERRLSKMSRGSSITSAPG